MELQLLVLDLVLQSVDLQLLLLLEQLLLELLQLSVCMRRVLLLDTERRALDHLYARTKLLAWLTTEQGLTLSHPQVYIAEITLWLEQQGVHELLLELSLASGLLEAHQCGVVEVLWHRRDCRLIQLLLDLIVLKLCL